jgi:hypothetical protein
MLNMTIKRCARRAEGFWSQVRCATAPSGIVEES